MRWVPGSAGGLLARGLGDAHGPGSLRSVLSKAFERGGVEHVRVSTAFNKMLRIVGAVVASVTFTPTGIVVGLRRRPARLVCPCGWKTWAVYDRSVRRWRHLDLARSKLWLEAEIRRLACRRCRRVRTEQVPWARPGARHTRDVQDLVAFMAQRMDKTTITRLLRVSWEPSPASSLTSSPTSSTRPVSTGCSASVSTRSPTARGIAISPSSPITIATAPSCGP
jgi:Helix-turn-helix domain of transposase family ISL3/zinc-finger of transposase IS204/IS1001/IS1096/IS1165